MADRDWGFFYNGKKNILWGCGRNGKELFARLLWQGIYVYGFCDSSKELQGLKYLNKKIYSPEEILKDIDKYNIVITTTIEAYRKEIYGLISSYSDVVEYEDVPVYMGDTIPYNFLYRMIRDAKERYIYIYSKNAKARKLKQTLELLDITVTGFVCDPDSYMNKEDEVLVYDLLNLKQGSYKIIIPGAYYGDIEVLEELGLTSPVDYNYALNYVYMNRIKYVLDPNLGYNFIGNKGLIGFDEYGEDEDYKIVIMGGSTTDTNLYPFQSWPEILCGKLRDLDLKVKIYVGAVTGYKSSQECVKILRDAIYLNPDMIISYTGVNDVGEDMDNPEYDAFIHDYQQMSYKYLAKCICKIDKLNWLYMDGKAIHHTIKKNKCEVFLNNIRCINDICNGRGIEYLPILQPNMSTKSNLGVQDKELRLVNWNEKYENGLRFYDEVNCGYLIDFTNIFDGVDGIYFDWCHVYEKGNKIIADCIANLIIPIIKKKYRKR